MGKTKNQQIVSSSSATARPRPTTFRHLRGSAGLSAGRRFSAAEIVADLQRISQESANQQQATEQARGRADIWELQKIVPEEIIPWLTAALANAYYRGQQVDISGHHLWAADILQRAEQLRQPPTSTDYFIGELRWSLALNLENYAAEQLDSEAQIVKLWSELGSSLYHCRQKAQPAENEEDDSYYPPPRDSWEEVRDIIASAEQDQTWAAGLNEQQCQAVKQGLQTLSALLENPQQPNLYQQMQTTLLENQRAFSRPLDEDRQTAERIRQAIAEQQVASQVLTRVAEIIDQQLRREEHR